MILATHAILGTAAAMALRQNPIAAFFAAFASHFVLDALPHWEYKLSSQIRHPTDPLKNELVFDQRFIRDLVKTGADCLTGTAISLLVVAFTSPEYIRIAFLGAIGGVLPDFLQLMYHFFPKYLHYLQWFHKKIQTQTRLNDMPVLGITLQIILAALFIAILIFAA